MAAADHGGPGPDLYQLLGVPREASREEIALAWRRRARDEHPDARPADADAPGRFRALAEAWRMLGDPDRRAAYDRALARERPPATRVPAAGARMPVRRPAGQGGPGPSGWKGRARDRPQAARMRRTSGWPCLRSWRCGTWPVIGAGRGEPGVGGPGPGPVQHIGGRGARRAASADAADLRAGGAAGPGAPRGRHPPVLPPGHRPAPGDLRTDRRRAEPGRHPPGPAVAGGDPPAAGRAGPAERTDRCPPGRGGTEPEAAYPPGR